MTPGRSSGWWALLAVAGPLALFAVAHWLWAIALRAPLLYGEGAVAHAAMLARDRLEYAPLAATDGLIFVAANYPPLYFHLAGIGDPFVTGRVLSIAATLFVAGAIAWTARSAGRVVALSLAAAWLAAIPVAAWGPALKPDLVALALTVGAVLALHTRPGHPLVAGVLVALATAAKPTAALPALALAVLLLSTDRGAFVRFAVAALAAGAAVLVATGSANARMLEHVVYRNALPWSAEQAALLGVVGLLVFGVTIVSLAIRRRTADAIGAYALAATGIVVLGGREGATVNYLLDLTAAASLGMAALAPWLRTSVRYPIAVAAQALVAVALLDPFGALPWRGISSGAWAPPDRLAVVREIPGDLLVEDAGLLIADGREARVDDIFLWSRLMGRADFPEGERLLSTVREGGFDAIVSEFDLARLSQAPLYERQRWHPALVSAVLDRYRFEREAAGLFVYRRR
ncbi:MAG: hypothetical protein WEE03_04125 [Chloroflexota bacterium]